MRVGAAVLQDPELELGLHVVRVRAFPIGMDFPAVCAACVARLFDRRYERCVAVCEHPMQRSSILMTRDVDGVEPVKCRRTIMSGRRSD